MTDPWISAKVVARREEASDIFSYELTHFEGQRLPSFTAGAHIDVQVGNTVRQYSLCNHPDERHRYLIAVLRDPATRGGSRAMHESVGEGDVIRISGPKNHFPLSASARKSLLFAGGIGITPILSMAERLSQLGADFELHYCARSLRRMAFVERLRRAEFADRVRLHVDDGDAAQKLDIKNALAGAQQDVHLYVCGPGGFMEWILNAAREFGWPAAQIHREYFSAQAPSSATAAEFDVQIAASGEVFTVPAGKSIVQVLAEHGVEIPTSCCEGVCGTCLTRVVDGEPEHLDAFLTDEEKARNDRMTPCCSRAKSRKLVLDL